MKNTYGNSVVNRQFVELVRNERPIHPPANKFVTLEVVEDERYCKQCVDVRVFDLWRGCQDGLEFVLGRCRCCGKELTL